ncbi:leukocyte antigen CD37 [Danio aesculapii]|uniref:leukocyte antigen CD37 n=1 Tax=Danio aesculapii TaxID=1142201 RepID=UPI0024C05E05|nr:leukocyte antigen CD37 [Danio aesculapii]
MASECCVSVTKYFLFLFNLVFFLLGSLLLASGLWMLLSDISDIKTFVGPILQYISISLLSYLLIVSGSVTMSLGFFGCLGSLKTVKFLLATYFILLTVLLAAQIVGGVLFYTMKSELSNSLEKEMDLIQSIGKNDSSFKETMDYIQKQGKCCGWEGKADWGDSIPCSCYNETNTNDATNETKEICAKCFPHSSNTPQLTCMINNEKGCKDYIENWLNANLHFILVVILAISVVEICGMILSMSLYKEGSVNYRNILL